MKVSFNGTITELYELMGIKTHWLVANVTYWNGNQRTICSSRPMTEWEIDDEVNRDGWKADGIKDVSFSLDSGTEPPFATYSAGRRRNYW